MNIRCFLLEPSGLAEYELRRYSRSELQRCPGNRWQMRCHDARVVIGRGPEHDHDWTPPPIHEMWPRLCDCGYEFRPEDHWQANDQRLFRRSDTGEEITLRDAPVGAIWRAEWLEGLTGHGGPDGKVYYCRLPGRHDWCIDGPAENAAQDKPGWQRTGEAPRFTVTPSVFPPGWHGYLRDGELVPVP